jgi:tRNA A37 methylthiotransferase MiaB
MFKLCAGRVNIFKYIKFSSKFCKKEEILSKLKDIPDMKTFMQGLNQENRDKSSKESYINTPDNIDNISENTIPSFVPKSFFIETHGCQMNENDTEIISSILQTNNYIQVNKIDDADVILTNTCAIRESAEEKVWNKIQHMKGIKKRNPEKIFGILGCMAERMKDKIFEKSNNTVDIIVGPDAYRDLPKMIDIISKKEDKFAMNVQLSLEETYADISPVRRSKDDIRAYVSIMRGCNNMCSFCIVPFTRGRERSRHYDSIEDEVKLLRDSVIYYIIFRE